MPITSLPRLMVGFRGLSILMDLASLTLAEYPWHNYGYLDLDAPSAAACACLFVTLCACSGIVRLLTRSLARHGPFERPGRGFRIVALALCGAGMLAVASLLVAWLVCLGHQIRFSAQAPSHPGPCIWYRGAVIPWGSLIWPFAAFVVLVVVRALIRKPAGRKAGPAREALLPIHEVMATLWCMAALYLVVMPLVEVATCATAFAWNSIDFAGGCVPFNVQVASLPFLTGIALLIMGSRILFAVTGPEGPWPLGKTAFLELGFGLILLFQSAIESAQVAGALLINGYPFHPYVGIPLQFPVHPPSAALTLQSPGLAVLAFRVVIGFCLAIVLPLWRRRAVLRSVS